MAPYNLYKNEMAVLEWFHVSTAIQLLARSRRIIRLRQTQSYD